MAIAKLQFLAFIFSFWITSAFGMNFADLTPDQKSQVMASVPLVIPVRVEDNSLKGDVFRYVKGLKPNAAAAVFFDYEQQYLFLRGMTKTFVKEWMGISTDHEWKGVRAIVTQHINPLGFVMSSAPLDTFHNWFFDKTSFRYDLVEDLYQEEGKEVYTVQWAEPSEDRAKNSNSDERGQIRFEPLEQGTLMSYSNATRPPFFGLKPKNAAPCLIQEEIQEWISEIAQRYYLNTVEDFVQRVQQVSTEQGGFVLWNEVAHMQAALSNSKGF